MKGVKGKHRMENIEKIKNDFKKISILVVILLLQVPLAITVKCNLIGCKDYSHLS